jgi:hypothetical protein
VVAVDAAVRATGETAAAVAQAQRAAEQRRSRPAPAADVEDVAAGLLFTSTTVASHEGRSAVSGGQHRAVLERRAPVDVDHQLHRRGRVLGAREVRLGDGDEGVRQSKPRRPRSRGNVP